MSSQELLDQLIDRERAVPVRIVPDRDFDILKDPEAPTAVYDQAQFGTQEVLYFPDNQVVNQTPPGTGKRLMLEPSQLQYSGVDSEVSGAAGATSTYNEVFDWLVDMPAWLLTIKPFLRARLVAGAGNTDTVTVELKITRVSDGLVLYDVTLTTTGLTADSTIECNFPGASVLQLLKWAETVQFQVIATSTRTAGASNTQIFFTQFKNQVGPSNVLMHVHPDGSHARLMRATRRTP